MNPPGRFLARSNPGQGGYVWEDIGDFAAKKRASKALGEREYKSKETIRDFQALEGPTEKPKKPQEMADGLAELGEAVPSNQDREAPLLGLNDAAQLLPYDTTSRPANGNLQVGFADTLYGSDGRWSGASQTLSNSLNAVSALPGLNQVQPSTTIDSRGEMIVSTNYERQVQDLLQSSSALSFASTSGAVMASFQAQQPTAPSKPADKETEDNSAALHTFLVGREKQQEQQFVTESEQSVEGGSEEKWNPNVDPDLPTAASLTGEAFSSSDSSVEKEKDCVYDGRNDL